MEILTYTTQQHWTTWFAVYLFLGGMGAAVVATSFLTHMYLSEEKELVMWGAISGVIMMVVGSGMLFLHLLNPWAVFYIVSPYGVFHKPDSWIAWGSQFIVWIQITAILYALPYMVEKPRLLNWPIVGPILKLPIVIQIANFAKRIHGFLGWVGIITGIGTAVYTGLLLQSFPAVTLWHNPAVPILFTVSAFSTAMAWLLIIMYIFIYHRVDHTIRALYERIDLGLITAELIIIFSFFNFTLSGSESGYRSADMLWNDNGWLIGFILFGLIVPLLMELKCVFGTWSGKVPIVTASLLVLNGGFQLRAFFMAAGIYAYPW
ncbi:MAG: polysulfide reductase NrfD [Magnetococcales bacterium]|nr:polysulfide reductase NrfD [Magnetococcales bacterium]MBF0148999.1 polysulfide reductase NrfD [Magnetococcales bacterium]MBF0172048.1 polysulfide reductase NrfD [Magnetococcales bacterium]MBF0346161.1 polysulfide reductase NrfD [Magnetococcales bacterium]MBF0630347.1 polysulfide reductase NrfD [Magnetococcales bacterium]